MFIRIRVPSKPPYVAYPIRKSSVAISAALHLGAVFFLLFAAPRSVVTSRTSDSSLQPKIRKMIVYDFRKRPPDVEPLKKVGDSPRARGAELSAQAVIATSAKPKSVQQTIWLPTPKVVIQRDVPLPNMIARMRTSLPAVPAISPVPKAKPQPAVEALKTAQPNPAPMEPVGDVRHAPEIQTEAAQPPKIVRTFVPPPAAPTQPKLPVPIQVSESPVVPSAGSPAMPSALPPGAGIRSTLPGASIPTSNAPVAPAQNAGNAKADVAIASLHPAENAKTAMPDGARPGRFSKAPETGAPASGDIGKAGAVTVPDLTVREAKPPRPPPDPTRTKAILYTERIRSIPVSTLSVALRPSNRTIPRAVDARFQGRNVYTMVVPIENLPAYAGDWIVWFAERQPVAGSTPLMRAPLPFRKMEPADQAVGSNPAQARVQISAILDKDGRLGKITILARPATMTELAVIQDLEAWEFKPATRDGIPVEVEVVVEIPFNLPAAVAKRTQP